MMKGNPLFGIGEKAGADVRRDYIFIKSHKNIGKIIFCTCVNGVFVIYWRVNCQFMYGSVNVDGTAKV